MNRDETCSAAMIYEFGEFRLSVEERLLMKGAVKMPLPPVTFCLLLKFVQEPNRLLSKEVLMAEVWPDTFVEEGNLNRAISRVRNLLGEKKGEKQYIETVPRTGYRFVAEVHCIGPGEAMPEAAKSLPSRKWRTALAAAIVLVSLAAFAIWIWLPDRIATRPDKPLRLAVLPVRPLVEDEESEILALGLADSMITKLGSISGFIVRPINAVSDPALKEMDPVQAGRKLDVDAVIDASLISTKGSFRLSIRLIDVSSGQQLWGERVIQTSGSIYEAEDKVSELTARAVVSHYSETPSGRLTRHYTDHPQAFEAYLKGRYFWNRRTEKNFREALAHFERAVELDPHYALAYSGLADCHILLTVWGAERPLDSMPKAKTAALKALEIDPTLAEAHASLAFIKWVFDWDAAGAKAEFDRSLELNAQYATAYHWRSYFNAVTGRPDAAISDIGRALEIEGPLSVGIMADVGEIYLWNRQNDRALTYLSEIVEIEPNNAISHYLLGIALVRNGDLNAATQELEKARAIENTPRITAALGYVYGKAGNYPKAAEIIQQLQYLQEKRYVSHFSIGVVYLGMGDRDECLSEFKRAMEERSDAMAILNAYPLLDDLKNDPEFRQLISSVGLIHNF
mgnify:CR=1 FL=1